MGKFLEEIKSSVNGRPSVLDQILADLPKQDATDLQEALADPTISAMQITRALNKRGYKISSSVIYRIREKLNESR
jgi:hypothetical protein